MTTNTDHRQQAEAHAQEAQELLGKKAANAAVHTSLATQATAHASLALFHQREADRLEGGR